MELPSDNYSNIDENNAPNTWEWRMGGSAFYGCSSLSNVYVLDNLSKIRWDFINTYQTPLSPSLLSNASDLAIYLRESSSNEVMCIKCYMWL